MLATALSAVLVGLTAHPVRVEVQMLRGIPSFELVGFAEAAVRESRVRVKTALAGVGIDLSEYRVVVNLAPADVKKRGAGFDLAIAMATLVALGVVEEKAIDGTLFLGELSLGGHILALRGLLPHLLSARDRGIARAIVPRANEEEASLVDGVDVLVAGELREVVAACTNGAPLSKACARRAEVQDASLQDDLADVRGQLQARRALEIAAAGAHNILFVGPPGAGKTMLARRLPGILPSLTREEALEIQAIRSVAGLARGAELARGRPFRAPHHTVSDAAMVGGGDDARPGDVSLAHNGVLFLDELSEFRSGTLDALRQPLEDGFITVSRAQATSIIPSRPIVVGATNPCPCGHRGDGTGRCGCKPALVKEYRNKVSGPLVDRLDVHVALPPVDVDSLQAPASGEASSIVRARVEGARAIQRDRQHRKWTKWAANAFLSASDLERVCRLDSQSRTLLGAAMKQYGLSARAYAKILRVSRTIADLEGADSIRAVHVGEAVGLRIFDRDVEVIAVNAA